MTATLFQVVAFETDVPKSTVADQSHIGKTLRVSGIVIRRATGMGGNQDLMGTNWFTVELDRRRWRVTLHFTSSGEHSELAYCDGQTVHYSLFQTGNAMTAEQASMNTNGVAISFIHNGSMPEEASVSGRFVWLALCSGGFLGSDSSGVMLVPWMLREGALGKSFRYTANLLPTPPGVPYQVMFAFSTNFWQTAVQAGQATAHELAAQPVDRYPDGWIGGKYHVARTITIGEFTVPGEATLERFARLSPAGHAPAKAVLPVTNILIEEYKLVATETALVDHEITIGSPPPPELASSIVDYRHATAQEPNLYIRWTNREPQWPARDDPRVPTLLAESRRMLAAAKNPKPNSGRKLVAASILLCVFLAPAGFVLLRAANRNKKTTPPRNASG
ncbi:MAG: hypothetical protein IH623_02540 [Verrucomicrobia bacterium]|nr:hypothetical protein [Verrucomicrobiota bacterium]